LDAIFQDDLSGLRGNGKQKIMMMKLKVVTVEVVSS
jgi:hypothetical protein